MRRPVHHALSRQNPDHLSGAGAKSCETALSSFAPARWLVEQVYRAYFCASVLHMAAGPSNCNCCDDDRPGIDPEVSIRPMLAGA
jgi:hypothetical protein